MFDLPPPDPGIEIAVASRGISKGLAQTDGAQLVAKGIVEFGSVEVGAQWKNVTSEVAEGEGALFAHWAKTVGFARITVGTTFKFQTGVRGPTDDKATEFNGSLACKMRHGGFRVSAIYSPDDFGSTGRSLYVEGGPTYDLTKSLKISANLGHRTRQNNPNYTSFNVGLSKAVGRLTFDIRYFDTAQGELGNVYHERIVISARLTL